MKKCQLKARGCCACYKEDCDICGWYKEEKKILEIRILVPLYLDNINYNK